MFDAGVARAALAALALSLGALRTGMAQNAAEYHRRLDSLGGEWHAAIGTVVKADSAQIHALPGDTIHAGQLLAISDSAHVSLARSTLARLAPEVDSAYGASARALTRRPFVIRTNERDTAVVVTGVADSMGVVHFMSSDFPNEKALTNSWHNKLDAVMTALSSAALQKWLRATIPTGTPSASDWNSDRIQLVLADSRVSQTCVRGDLTGCLEAFSLLPVADPAFELYDDAGQRGIINAHGYLLRQSDPTAYDACMTHGVRAACDKLLRSMPVDAIPQPLPASLRQSLVRYALSIGGAGAFDRLVGTQGTPRQQLEAAARMPADSLVSKWRAMALRTRNASSTIDVETALASIAWAGLFAGLSLRSSRWR